MVQVIAIIHAKPGMRSKILAFLHANIPNVLAEPGCIEYMATVDASDAPALQTPIGPDSFIVFERWADMPSFHAHAHAPHVITYRKNTAEFIDSRTVHVLSAL
jgi:quinol monooxygenase YgiN